MTDLQNKVILITGASSGIGRELALQCAASGAKVACCGRRSEKLNELAALIESKGGECLAIPADITDKTQAEQFVYRTIEHFGGLDIVVNNAGRGNIASVEDTTQEQLQSIFAVNVFALWYITAPALSYMRSKGSGHIINIASVAGTMGFPFNSAYVAAKHAVMGFTASLRAELIGSGIHATAVCPDGVITEWGMVTEGGPIANLFGEGIKLSRSIAREKGIALAPLSQMMSAADAAQSIIGIMDSPPSHDHYTHQGSEQRAAEVAVNRNSVEQKMMALFLGMQQAYHSRK